MNDFIALIMIIVVYFLPYFFIFTLIKLSAGSLGKLQAGLDSINDRTKKSGLFGLKDKAKADREAFRDQKKRNAFQKLANDEFRGRGAKFSRWNARRQAGVLPIMGAGKTVKQSNRRREELAVQKGIQESIEEENLADKTIAMKAENIQADWKNSGELDRRGRSLLVEKATIGSVEEKRAAMQMLTNWGDASGMQQVIDHFESGAVTDNASMKEYFKAKGSNDFARQFMSKRSDWIKRDNEAADPRMRPGPAYDTFGAAELARYHSSGIEYTDQAGNIQQGEFVKYLEALEQKAKAPGASTKDIQKYDEFVIRMGSSLQQMLVDPEARTAASANATTLKGYKAHLTRHLEEVATRTHSEGATAGYLTLEDHISSDGTIK
jgi:hypothetical protein